MGWIIALGVLTLIAILPVGISVLYDEEGFRTFLMIGVARICLYPPPKKEKKQPQKNTEKSSTKTKKASSKQKKKGGKFQDFLPLLDKVLEFLNAFRKKLRVKHLDMKMVLAGDDPADLATNYGKAWVALGNLMPLLERVFVIRKRNLEVECDFMGDCTTITARFDISITVGRTLLLVIVQGIPVLQEFLKIMKIRKGGAKA